MSCRVSARAREKINPSLENVEIGKCCPCQEHRTPQLQLLADTFFRLFLSAGVFAYSKRKVAVRPEESEAVACIFIQSETCILAYVSSWSGESLAFAPIVLPLKDLAST
jgi:hypothetical protein